MRVIPVIDLLNGVVVRGIAGRREEYRPIESAIAPDCQPASVARAFAEQYGFDTVYVADLDAIAGRPWNTSAWQAIHKAGLALWLDAGIGTPLAFSKLIDELKSNEIAATVVVALEALEDPDDEAWLDQLGRHQRLFSLDLKNGIPVHRIVSWRDRLPAEIARSMHARGYFEIIVLDTADVGIGSGTSTLPLCKQLIAELHPVRIIAGGGVQSLADLQALQAAGCGAALVASALHDKRLTPEDIRPFTN